MNKKRSDNDFYKILAIKTVLRAILATMGDPQRNAAVENVKENFERIESDIPELNAELKIIQSFVKDIFNEKW